MLHENIFKAVKSAGLDSQSTYACSMKACGIRAHS